MAWTPGHQLKSRPFVVDCLLGEGGFGITYKVHHQFLNQDFVIKTPNARLQNDPDYQKYLNRFIQEGQRVAKICHDPHPHIVRVTDLFEEAGIHCLVMDYVPGESLWKYVQNQGALSEEQAVRYIRQIGEALRVVHKAGLVHRDATPLNIMVRSPEKAVLIDFGIAKGLIPTTSTTTDKAGNQGFAPYEQIGLGSREVTVDVYTLAASLYYAVTGQRPMGSLGRKLFNAELVPPQQLIPGLSDAINQAILSGMKLEPEDRPQSMEEWLELLTFEPPIIRSVTSPSVESSATVQPAKTAKTLPVSAFDFEVVTVEVKSGWFVVQQSQGLSLCLSQLEFPRLQELQPGVSGCLWCGVDSLALDTFALLPFTLFSFPSSRLRRVDFFSIFDPISIRICQNTSCNRINQ